MTNNEVIRLYSEHCTHSLFLKTQKGKIIVLIIYVDDMIVTADDVDEMTKHLGALKYFFSIEVIWSEQGIYLSQCKCILDLLKERI